MAVPAFRRLQGYCDGNVSLIRLQAVQQSIHTRTLEWRLACTSYAVLKLEMINVCIIAIQDERNSHSLLRNALAGWYATLANYNQNIWLHLGTN